MAADVKGVVVPKSSSQQCSERPQSEDESNNRTKGFPAPVMKCSTKRLITVNKYRERNKTRAGAGTEEIPVSRRVGFAPAQTVLVQPGLPAALVLTEITKEEDLNRYENGDDFRFQ